MGLHRQLPETPTPVHIWVVQPRLFVQVKDRPLHSRSVDIVAARRACAGFDAACRCRSKQPPTRQRVQRFQPRGLQHHPAARPCLFRPSASTKASLGWQTTSCKRRKKARRDPDLKSFGKKVSEGIPGNGCETQRRGILRQAGSVSNSSRQYVSIASQQVRLKTPCEASWEQLS